MCVLALMFYTVRTIGSQRPSYTSRVCSSEKGAEIRGGEQREKGGLGRGLGHK